MTLNKNINIIKKDRDDVSSSETSQVPVSGRRNKYHLVLGVLVLVILVLAVGLVKTQRDLINLRTPEGQEVIAQEEIEKVIIQAQKHILIPEGETPTMATIVNAEVLIAEQPFYRGAQDGDKVILYLETQRAIIYSPERDIIVNVGPLLLNNQASQ